jgi:hypothetical protein
MKNAATTKALRRQLAQLAKRVVGRYFASSSCAKTSL